MDNRRGNNKFNRGEKNSLSEGGRKPKLKKHEELLERMREFLPRKESPFDPKPPSGFKLKEVDDGGLSSIDFLVPPPPLPPKNLSRNRITESGNGFETKGESRGKTLAQEVFREGQPKEKGLPLPGNVFTPENIFNLKEEPKVFLKSTDSRENFKMGYDSIDFSRKGTFDSRNSKEFSNTGTGGAFDSLKFPKMMPSDSIHSQKYSKMVPPGPIDSLELLEVVPSGPIDSLGFSKGSTDSLEFSKGFPPGPVDSVEFSNLVPIPPHSYDSREHSKKAILKEFVPVPDVSIELVPGQVFDPIKDQSTNGLLKGFSKKDHLETPVKTTLIVDDDISDEIDDFDDFKENFANIQAEPLFKQAKELDFRNKILQHPKMDNKTAALILVLMGSLSPFLNLSTNGVHPLGEYRKHDLPASIIHFPDLPSKFDSDEIENELFPLVPTVLPAPLVPPVPPLPFISPASGKSFNGDESSDPEKCNLKYFAYKCQNFNNGFCIEDENYPLADIGKILKNDPNLVSKYAEVVEQSADDLVSFIKNSQENSFDYSGYNPFNYDESHWFGPEGYICPSNVTYGRPVRGINARGEWKYILNDGDFYSQTLRIETCLFTNTPCRMIAPCFKSRCVQKYSYHRLLSFDPCNPSKGLYTEIFRFPSACSCYTPEFQGIDDILALDLRRKKEKGV
ncbi:UNVERIFIED_CONTAM: hypothetical protein RMT77_004870 [Armadillidium vulgare]